LYGRQFVSLDSSSAGFILKGLRRAMARKRSVRDDLPYCMNPLRQAAAGDARRDRRRLILGTLALRTRSIWVGVLIHIGVAITNGRAGIRGVRHSAAATSAVMKK